MKMSVSLGADDVAFLDAYAAAHTGGSRSAAVAAAVRALRESELSDAYAQAFAEWNASGEADLWEPVAGDGLS